MRKPGISFGSTKFGPSKLAKNDIVQGGYLSVRGGSWR